MIRSFIHSFIHSFWFWSAGNYGDPVPWIQLLLEGSMFPNIFTQQEETYSEKHIYVSNCLVLAGQTPHVVSSYFFGWGASLNENIPETSDAYLYFYITLKPCTIVQFTQYTEASRVIWGCHEYRRQIKWDNTDAWRNPEIALQHDYWKVCWPNHMGTKNSILKSNNRHRAFKFEQRATWYFGEKAMCESEP